MRTISLATRNVTLAVLTVAVFLLALAQFLPALLIPAAPDLPPVDTRFAACASAGPERSVPCQRIAAGVDTASPLELFGALARSGAACNEVAGELGRVHWVTDHRLPAYADNLGGCNGAFITAVITSMLDSGVRGASIEQLAGWCPEGVEGCADLVVAALDTNPAARAWFCELTTNEDACGPAPAKLPQIPRVGDRLGRR